MSVSWLPQCKESWLPPPPFPVYLGFLPVRRCLIVGGYSPPKKLGGVVLWIRASSSCFVLCLCFLLFYRFFLSSPPDSTVPHHPPSVQLLI